MNFTFHSPVASCNVGIFMAAIVALAMLVNAAPVSVYRDDNCDFNIADGHSCTPDPGNSVAIRLLFSLSRFVGLIL
jgi:hypothetical protein